MKDKKNHLIHGVTKVKPGDHLCWLYETEEEHRALSTPFLRQGLERGEKVVYIVDGHTVETILGYLQDDGLEVEPYLARGQLSIFSVDDAYMRDGSFDPDGMISLLRTETERALAEGYSALRVTGEMSWVLRGLPGSERLIEYESKLNTFFPNSQCLAICQYDRQFFDAKVLLDILATHPFAVVGTQLYDNFYYIPPREFLGSERMNATLHHWLENLEKHKLKEETLRENEAKLRAISASAQDAILMMDNEGKIAYWNKAAERILGYSSKDALGKELHRVLVPQRYHDAHRKGFARFKTTGKGPVVGKTLELVAVRKDGTEFPIELSVSAAKLKGQWHSIGILRDITERKRAEEALRKSEERFRNLIEATSDWIWEVDENGVYTYISPRIRDILGYEPEEVLGKTPFDLMPPEEAGRVVDIFGTIAASQKPFASLENTNIHKDGCPVVLETSGVPFFGVDGTFRGYRGIDRDITERKRMEQELICLERLRARGEMSVGISHNLNNILVGILGPAQLLEMAVHDSQALRHIREIIASATQAKDVVHGLHQAVHDVDTNTLEAVLVNQVIHESIQAVRPRWKDEEEAKGITVEIMTKLENTPPIQGTQYRLHDVLIRLLSNAFDALPEGGRIIIGTRFVEKGVQLTVSDTGIGMDEETRGRVFEPFFTTKMEVGSGLGLTIVYSTVTSWGGSIKVASEPGKGTTFTLYLPVWEETETDKVAAATGVPLVRPHRILIVEDDEAVRVFLSNLLSRQHQVEVALHGQEAVEKFAPGRYDVVLIDLGMPGMSGDRIAEEIRQLDPAVATILVTGWEFNEDDPKLSAFDFRIQKPFDNLQEVKNVVAQAVELHNARAEG